MLLQLFVTLSHFRWHLIELFVRFDRTTEEHFPLRILRGEEFLAILVFDPEFPFVIGEDNLRFVQVDGGPLERAVVASYGVDAFYIPSCFIGCASRFLTRP